MAEDKYHGFGDVYGTTDGIFGRDAGGLGDANGGFHKPVLTPTKEGLLVDFHCPHCTKPRQMALHYAELICAVHGRQPEKTLPKLQPPIPGYEPSPWTYDPNIPAWVPVMRDGCGYVLTLAISTQELMSALEHARRADIIKTQAEQALIQAIQRIPPG